MNIQQTKKALIDTVRLYFSKDEWGFYEIPTIRQRPILLMGPPGIGKTQIVQQVAQECSIGFVSYTMTHHTRQSAIGLPMITTQQFSNQTYSITEYTMSEILANVYETIEKTGISEGILFLDEINCVSETLAPMMLQFLQSKMFGNQRLPDGWLIVTAGNPPEYNQSVREFDAATLDRVRKIDVTPDYTSWKSYALKRKIHPAILSYLELKKDSFYQMELSAQDIEFVTPRGWEDLSEWMLLCEKQEILISEHTILQYLQMPRIAKDFAAYFSLYTRYQKVYEVDTILQGKWEPLTVRELRSAPFDERLSMVQLLLSRLHELAYDTWFADALANKMHLHLKDVKIYDGTLCDALALEQEKIEQELFALEHMQNTDPMKRRLILQTQTLLKQYQSMPENSFDTIKQAFQELVAKRTEWIQTTDNSMTHAFSFLEESVGQSHEMVLFATELTARFALSWFLEQFSNNAYLKQNQALLFDDTQQKLQHKIARAKQKEADFLQS